MQKLRTWKERQYIENWTKRIEITALYQIQAVCDQMGSRAEATNDKELSRWSGTIKMVIAKVNGEITDFDLKRYEMSEANLTREERAVPDLRILKNRDRDF
jgi:hypothetical protein